MTRHGFTQTQASQSLDEFPVISGSTCVARYQQEGFCSRLKQPDTKTDLLGFSRLFSVAWFQLKIKWPETLEPGDKNSVWELGFELGRVCHFLPMLLTANAHAPCVTVVHVIT